MFQLHEAQRKTPLPARYVAPRSLDDILDLLSEHGSAARLIAGGTDLMLELSRGTRTGVDLLIDISAVPGFDQITIDEDRRVTLGPLVAHADVIYGARWHHPRCAIGWGRDLSSPLLDAGLPLAQACLEVGSPPLRNRATVVGNVVTASPANDTISALTALGAQVTIASVRGERTMPISKFITGFRQTALAPDEMVTAISFDGLSGVRYQWWHAPGIYNVALDSANGVSRRGVFVKLGLRRAQAISVVHAAVVVEQRAADGDGDGDGDGPGQEWPGAERHPTGRSMYHHRLSPAQPEAPAARMHRPGGTVTDLVVALGSVAPTIITVPEAADLANGRALDEAADDIVEAARRAATPIDDIRAGADYRSHAVGVVIERAVAALASGTEAAQWPQWPRHQPLLSLRRRGMWDRNDQGTLTMDRSTSRRRNRARVREPAATWAGLGPTDSNGAEPAVLAEPDDIVTATVNGVSRSAPGASGKTLMDWLRDDLGLTGTKEGCAEGECGACTVHLDDDAVFSCLVPAGRAAGAAITTVEGAAPGPGKMHPFQRAMVTTGGVQCGFCTPGFVMSAAALLDEMPRPEPEQIAVALSGNLCRCTGYGSIIEAVNLATKTIDRYKNRYKHADDDATDSDDSDRGGGGS